MGNLTHNSQCEVLVWSIWYRVKPLDTLDLNYEGAKVYGDEGTREEDKPRVAQV